MAVSLDKITPGVSALEAAITKDGPGLKFISIRQLHEWASLYDSAEALYGGSETGMLWGPATQESIRRVAGIVDGALHRGLGHLVVVTEHPPGPGGREDVPHLTVTRYLIDSNHGVRHVTQQTREDYGKFPDAFEAAERDRLAMDAAHIARVAAALAARREARARLREQAAARLASTNEDATA